MAATPPQKKFRTLLFGGIVGSLLTVVAGIVCLWPVGKGLSSVGEGLTRFSYDLPFLFQARPTDELVMVYFDSKVKRNLGEPVNDLLARRYYTQLLERLTDDGAKLVLIDVLFDAPSSTPATDEQFARAIHRNGRVVLVGDYIKELQGNVMMDSPLPPLGLFAAASHWGLAKISPDADLAIRRLDTGVADYPSVSWAAAALLDAPATKDPSSRLGARWLNYYGPPDQFRAINFDHALEPGGLSAGYFRDKIVVVGARPGVGLADAAREAFPNPFSRFGQPLASGAALHALSLLNLLHGDWLVRQGTAAELAMVLCWGIFITLLLMSLRPWPAVGVGIVCAALFAVVAGYIQLHRHVWSAWAIPAVAQTSVALVWGVGYRFVVADHRRRQLRRAFSAYLSPYMADRIANSEFDLALGGQEIEASIMFTDLEGFAEMSESLPPSEVSKILVAYFNQTTRAILEQEGTIIKYIGDAVMAVWGAPLPEKRHAQRAVLAAWSMSQAGKKEIAGRSLHTRIGVHTGIVLSGNLGSEFRFDYTCIGDTTNVAARLESLNKQLGTDVLISESTAQQLDGSIKLRPLGRFIAVGKKKAVGIFEVLGLTQDFPQDPQWLLDCARALEQFQRRELDAAETGFQAVIAQRGGRDGPSEFYLKEIAAARQQPQIGEEWTGAVTLHSK